MDISLRQYYEILARYLSQQKGRFAWLAFLVISSIGLQIVNPQIMRYFIDAATTGSATANLTMAAIGFLGAALLQQLLAVSATYMGESVAWTATNALREDLALHCLNLDMRFHNDKSPGELIERIEGDVTEFSTFFSQLVIRVLGNILLLIGILIALYIINWQLGLGFTVFTITTVFVLNRVRNIAIPYQKAHRDANTELFGFLEERLAGTEDIRSSGAVDYVIRKLFQLHSVILTRWKKASLMNLGIGATTGLMLMGGYTLAFVLGFHLYKAGLMTIGTAYLVLHYTNLISRPIREISQQVESLQNIGATVERMGELLGEKSVIVDGKGAGLSKGEPISLNFDGVSFAYAENKPVLNELSFNLEAGKILGLLGRTGAGKTTLARLIFRLYDPTDGRIRVDGKDIREATLDELRGRVAFVTQDVQLFQASVRDNITLFSKNISDEKIMKVIEILGLMDWFTGLPHGLDTRIQSGGRSLSAGEAQLLALTRVFLKDPGLVILDEASSRLDPATEQLVERAIDRLLHGRTAIIIAHRLATVHRSDDVLILEDGNAVEYGNRQKLLSNSGSRFFSLHQTGMEEFLA